MPRSADEINRLMSRAENGDESAVPALRKLLAVPGMLESLGGGSLAVQAERSLVELLARKNLAAREVVLQKLQQLRAELAGPSPTPVERILVERAVACWLQLQAADLRLQVGESKYSLAQGEYHHRQRDRAHYRFLSAVKALATVRRLALPVLIGQLNVARKQVNIATASAGKDLPDSTT
jgi:hypothetical protein